MRYVKFKIVQYPNMVVRQLISSACYDTQQVCVYQQPFSR